MSWVVFTGFFSPFLNYRYKLCVYVLQRVASEINLESFWRSRKRVIMGWFFMFCDGFYVCCIWFWWWILHYLVGILIKIETWRFVWWKVGSFSGEMDLIYCLFLLVCDFCEIVFVGMKKKLKLHGGFDKVFKSCLVFHFGVNL